MNRFSLQKSPSFLGALGLLSGLGVVLLSPSVALAADTVKPNVGVIAPTSGVSGSSVNFYTTASDDVQLASCNFDVDNGNVLEQMTLSDFPDNSFWKKAAITMTLGTGIFPVGTHTLKVQCFDTSGNWRYGNPITFTVTAPPDTQKPTVGTLSPTTVVSGGAATFAMSYSDNVVVTSCVFKFQGGVNQNMTLTNYAAPVGQPAPGSASINLSFPANSYPAGNYPFSATCYDAAGNSALSSTFSITVTAQPTDTQKPTVGALSPTTGVSNATVTFGVSYSDDKGVSVCNLDMDGALEGMNLTDYAVPVGQPFAGGASLAVKLTPSLFPVGSHTFKVQCYDAAGNVGYSPSTTITVTAAPQSDTIAPTVPAVQPTSVTAGVSTSISVNPTDNVGVTSCALYEGGDSFGGMTKSGNNWSMNVTLSAGVHSMHAECRDAANNIGFGTNANVTAGAVQVADTVVPTVSALTPASVKAGIVVGFNATHSDNVGVTECKLVENGVTLTAASISGSASSALVILSAGSHALQMQCKDAAGNWGSGPITTVTATSEAVVPEIDTKLPSVSQVLQSLAVAGSSITLSSTYYDNVGVTACVLYVNGVDAGNLALADGMASKNYAFNAAGTYNVQVSCKDAAGNTGSGTVRQVTVLAGQQGSDVSPPSVGQITQGSAVPGVSLTLTAPVSDDVGVTACDLYVGGSYIGAMQVSGGIASRNYAFGSAGSYNAYAVCRDAAGNASVSTVRTISVSSQANPPMPSGQVQSSALPTSLLKIACPSGAMSDHPCKAVYYFGLDGKRHAFPNDKVYFTWYANFDGVITVTDAFLASLPLGKSVNYRPGVRMVKFTTLNNVYAVGKGGVLRWVTTEAAAVALYGSNWNTKIDDISDAFFSNYTFGANINSAADFSPAGEMSSATTIDANF